MSFKSMFIFMGLLWGSAILFMSLDAENQRQNLVLKKISIECNSLSIKDSIQKYFSQGYSLKQNFIISTQFKDMYDATHFPGGKGLATSQYLLIFEKP